MNKLLKIVFQDKISEQQFFNICRNGDVEFEDEFNWDLIIKDFTYYLCSCDWSNETRDECDCELRNKFIEQNNLPEDENDLRLGDLFCEIRPILRDDYPMVLKKMKEQIELTNYYAEKENIKIGDQIREEYGSEYNIAEYSILPNYVLIVKDFVSKTSKEDLIKLFEQDQIKVVFVNEILTSSVARVWQSKWYPGYGK